ncbi:MAG: ABC transporter ATP-binding protein [bacterium]
MIEFRNVTRMFGDVVGVEDLNFQIEKGEVVGLLGANGAGKTTTMRLMTGYYPPTEGEVRFGGKLIQRNPLDVKRQLGYLPEVPPLYEEMVAREYLRYTASLKEVSPKNIESSIDRVLGQLDLTDHAHRLIGNLSRGYRQRVALAQALLHEPEFIVLDEPTLGLDPNQVRRLRELINELAENSTLIISSHILPEVRQLCERIIVLQEGRIVAVDTPEQLAREELSAGWQLTVDSAPSDWKQSVLDLEEVETCRETGKNEYEVVFRKDDRLGRTSLFELCSDRDVPIMQLTRPDYDLEELFFELTREEETTEEETDESIKQRVQSVEGENEP